MAKAFKRRCTEVMVHDFSGDTMKMLPVCEMKQCVNPRATNCHLYHYANNNPVCYTDPDGRDVDFSITTEQNKAYLLRKINSMSILQFKINGNNLELDYGVLNINGSELFTSVMLKAMACNYKIYLSIRSTIPEEWSVEEGVDRNIYGGANYVFHDNKRAYAFISPEIYTFKGQDDAIHPANHDAVLMHELAGHILPKITGENNNAVFIENLIRQQLGWMLREEDPLHVSF